MLPGKTEVHFQLLVCVDLKCTVRGHNTRARTLGGVFVSSSLSLQSFWLQQLSGGDLIIP